MWIIGQWGMMSSYVVSELLFPPLRPHLVTEHWRCSQVLMLIQKHIKKHPEMGSSCASQFRVHSSFQKIPIFEKKVGKGAGEK